MHISQRIFHVLDNAIQIGSLTGGAFDVTLAPLVELWRQVGHNGSLPEQGVINEHMLKTGGHHLHLDRKALTAFLDETGCAVDLGGIGKGFAADECIRLYEELGAEAAFVNLGGNVKVFGKKPDGSPWRIGIQHPNKPRGEYFGILSIENQSVVTSGGYERYVQVDTRNYHHILDGRTGYPSASDLISVTVVHGNSMLADAIATGLFVMGMDKAIGFLQENEEYDAILISEDHEPFISTGIKEQFHSTGSLIV